MRINVFAAALLGFVLAAAAAAAEDAAAVLYRTRCATCHGAQGDGQGPAAYLLYPRPRDFTKGTYRLRSTPSGSLPTDADLLRTVTNGIPGTAMPSFADLPEADRQALVDRVKRFSARFQEEKAAAPISSGAEPEATPADVASGKEVYAKMQCAACHGEKGRGDGPSAATLRDEDGMPIRPFDFTRGGRAKSGPGAADLFRAMTTGLDGTPMPGYADSLTEKERWSVVHYVASLGAGTPPLPSAASEIAVAQVAKLPEDAGAPEWSRLPPTTVALRSLWARAEGAEALLVRAATDGKAIAFQLEWADRIADRSAIRPQDFRDAVAVQFPLGGSDEPFFGMGEKGRPVNIWHWRADWQADLEVFADVDKRYPAMAVDLTQVSDQATPFHTGAAVKNPMSDTRRTTPVENLVATGLGTLTSLPPEDQRVRGAGAWADGTWRVEVRRDLASAGGHDAQLAGRASIPVAFAVWDGSAGDRNGQKRVSTWVTLTLPAAAAKAPAASAPAPLPPERCGVPGGSAGALLIAALAWGRSRGGRKPRGG